MQAVAEVDTCQEGGEYGCIGASTNQNHLFAVGVGGLYVVDAHGYEREAGGIDQDVDDGSQTIVCGSESINHLHQVLYGKSKHGYENQPS